MAFTQKILTAIIQLQTGSFAGGSNTLTLSGLRMSATVSLAAGEGQSSLQNLTIYGMSLAQMNQASLIGNMFPLSSAKQLNHIQVMAGDAETGMKTIFHGDIVEAFVDANAMPDVKFMVTGRYSNWQAKTTAPPLTRPGAVDVASLASQLAGQMGLTLENSGVSKPLSNPYLHGTAISQMRQLAEAGGFQWFVDNQTLAIWPTGSARKGNVILISPETGLVGYPRFSHGVINLTCLFNPQITFGPRIKVQSSIAGASGLWNVNGITYTLDSLTPHGRWFMEITAANANIPASAEPSGDD